MCASQLNSLFYAREGMTESPSTVDCAEHGPQAATFVCKHLPSGRGVGFNQAYDPEDPDSLFPDAWCDSCEAERERKGGWDDASEAAAGIRVLCSGCYLKARLLNWPQPTHTETAELTARAVEYAQSQQDALREQYRLSDHERYDWHQEPAQLVFSNQGVPAVVADVQFVGSISTRSCTWLWSWANQSFVETARTSIRRVRSYGEERGLMKLACAYWGAEEADGWGMAAVSAYLLDAKGVYRSPDEHGYTFLVMTDIRWAQ
jgi:hypothetical protein